MMGQKRTSRWRESAYTCVDGTRIVCRHETIEIIELDEHVRRHVFVTLRSGIQLDRGTARVVDSAETVLDRTMTEVVRGCVGATYTLPLTVTSVRDAAFVCRLKLRSVRLNDGL